MIDPIDFEASVSESTDRPFPKNQRIVRRHGAPSHGGGIYYEHNDGSLQKIEGYWASSASPKWVEAVTRKLAELTKPATP